MESRKITRLTWKAALGGWPKPQKSRVNSSSIFYCSSAIVLEPNKSFNKLFLASWVHGVAMEFFMFLRFRSSVDPFFFPEARAKAARVDPMS